MGLARSIMVRERESSMSRISFWVAAVLSLFTLRTNAGDDRISAAGTAENARDHFAVTNLKIIACGWRQTASAKRAL